MEGEIYPIEHKLDKANSCDAEVTVLYLDLSIINDTVYSKIHDK